APPQPSSDGGDNIADIVAVVAGDKRGVVEERRIAAQAATRDRVRAASAAAAAAAHAAAMPGELEDLGGAPPQPPAIPAAPPGPPAPAARPSSLACAARSSAGSSRRPSR